MESNYFENRLIKKDIKKIKREYLDNIFSTKLKSSMTIIIMKYLDIKDLYEFAKLLYIFLILLQIMKIMYYINHYKKKKEKIYVKYS